MRHVALILGLAALVAGRAGVHAKPAYVPSTVNLRSAPGTTNEILAKIPGGSLVDADNCKDGWCAVTWQDKSGFAIETALDLSGRVPGSRMSGPPIRRAPAYVEDDGYMPEPPPPAYYGPPPVYYGGYYGPYYRRGWGWRRW